MSYTLSSPAAFDRAAVQGLNVNGFLVATIVVLSAGEVIKLSGLTEFSWGDRPLWNTYTMGDRPLWNTYTMSELIENPAFDYVEERTR